MRLDLHFSIFVGDVYSLQVMYISQKTQEIKCFTLFWLLNWVLKCFLFSLVDILVGDFLASAGCSIFVQQIVFIHPTLTWKVLQQADAPAVSKTIYQSFFEKHFLMTSTFFWVGWGWGFLQEKTTPPHFPPRRTKTTWGIFIPRKVSLVKTFQPGYGSSEESEGGAPFMNNIADCQVQIHAETPLGFSTPGFFGGTCHVLGPQKSIKDQRPNLRRSLEDEILTVSLGLVIYLYGQPITRL